MAYKAAMPQLVLLLLLASAATLVPASALAGSSRLHELSIMPSLLGGNSTGQQNGQFAGYFDLDRTHAAKMFYFYFEARDVPPAEAPLVLWMTGGPGCSSELAVFFENGPWTINDDLTLKWTKYGWDTAANMIFVDQPIGTGFSFSHDPRDIVHSERQVAEDMYDFLQEFLAAHPDLADRDFFITGESYAGHYVPAVGSRVFLGNKEIDAGKVTERFVNRKISGPNGGGNREHVPWKKINIQGIAIGNGLTDPAIQYTAYGDFAFANGLITQSVYDGVQKQVPGCVEAIKLCQKSRSAVLCIFALERCNAMLSEILMAAGNINVYDIRRQCEVPPLCYDFSNMDRYLKLPEVRQQLGVGDRPWVACSPGVHTAMLADWMREDLEPVIPPMLEAGIRVLIYVGEADFICNHEGNSRWVEAMEWSGHDEYTNTPATPWFVDDKEAGTAREVGLLTFLKLHEAGHMVPMDQPKHALAMLTTFTSGEPFVDTSSGSSNGSDAGVVAEFVRLDAPGVIPKFVMFVRDVIAFIRSIFNA